MNITKEQIVDWVCKSIYPMATEDGELSEIIKLCFNDLSPKWVSVDDRLPDNTKAVLVYVASTQGPSFTEIDHFVNGEFHFQALSKCNSVTHWAPLPEPPK